MLQYIINVTDNSFVYVITLSFLFRLYFIQVDNSKKAIFVSAVCSFIFSLCYVILKSNTGFMIREYYDLAFFIAWIISFLVLSFLSYLIFLKNKPSDLFWTNCFKISIFFNLVANFSLLIPNLLLFPFEFNVAMESVFNNEYLLKWIGYILAISLMLLVFTCVNKITQKLPHFFNLLIIHLSLLTVAVMVGIKIVQILFVRRYISSQEWLMDAIIFFSSYVNLFAFIFIGITFILAISLLLTNKLTSVVFKNPAQRRKITANIKHDRRTCLKLIIGVLVTGYVITRLREIEESGVEISEAEPIFATNGIIYVPIERVKDGNLHRFGYETTDGTVVRFIVIKKSENAYGIGLDACDICGIAGYYQRGHQVVCSKCDVVMNIATIGLSGGCNPVPLKYDISNENINIKAIYLELEKSRFK